MSANNVVGAFCFGEFIGESGFVLGIAMEYNSCIFADCSPGILISPVGFFNAVGLNCARGFNAFITIGSIFAPGALESVNDSIFLLNHSITIQSIRILKRTINLFI
jgi:hypothetical protein